MSSSELVKPPSPYPSTACRNSARGFFITGYCLGRRFLTRGSYRPGRRGLTTSSGISSPSSAPRNHLSAVDEADPIRFDTLTARRLAHRHPHQVVCQGVHRQFLEHSIHCHALQHIHLHRLLQRLQVFLYPPPRPIKSARHQPGTPRRPRAWSPASLCASGTPAASIRYRSSRTMIDSGDFRYSSASSTRGTAPA